MAYLKYRLLFIVPLLLVLMFLANAQQEPLPLPTNADDNLTRAIGTLIEKQKLITSDGVSNEDLGHKIALQGNTALIATGATNAVYVFTYDANTGQWSEQQKLTASGGPGETFGRYITIDGDTALIAAEGEYTYTGSVYVFTRDTTSGLWSQQQRLTASDGEITDHFGTSVALDGDTALIGMDNDGDYVGSAYVFMRDADTGLWNEFQKFTASDVLPGDEFGHEVALEGETALIGTFGSEAVYAFERDANTGLWSEQQILTASDGVINDYFGTYLALEGDTLLVSALAKDSGSGAVYLFERDSSTDNWIEKQKLTPAVSAIETYFGGSISMDGDNLLVGAPGDNAFTGSAYVFVRNAATDLWSEQQKLTASDGTVDSLFGMTVVLQGSTALIDAPFDNVGSVYFFQVPEPTLNIELSADSVSIAEGDSGTSATGLSLLVSGGVSTVINSVDVMLTDDTATSADNDYSQTTATISIPAGDYSTVQSIAIPADVLGIVGDTKFEEDETFSIGLANAGLYAQIGNANGDGVTQSSAIVTILNDDAEPTATLATLTPSVTPSLTPSQTPTATQTPEPDEALFNGGFEGDKVKGVPVGWNGKDTTLFRKDKQKCNKDKDGDNIIDKFVSHSGDCAFLFKGNPTGERTKLNQKFSDLSPFTDGATLTLSVYVDKRSAKAGHPFGKLIVKYKDGRKDKVILRIPDADGYTPVSDSVIINLNGSSLDVVKVSFRNRLTSGKFFIDDASLTVTPATALKQQRDVLPVPEGFRD